MDWDDEEIWWVLWKIITLIISSEICYLAFAKDDFANHMKLVHSSGPPGAKRQKLSLDMSIEECETESEKSTQKTINESINVNDQRNSTVTW